MATEGTEKKEPRYTVIGWQRGSYGIVDTAYPIGDQRRRVGVGFKRRRDAEAEARRRNRKEA